MIRAACLVVLLVVKFALLVHAEDEPQDVCMPKGPPPENHTHHWDCCSADILPESLSAAFNSCLEEYPRPPRPQGQPPEGVYRPPPEVFRHFTCVRECVFAQSGLLAADKQLDAEAVKNMFVTSDPDVESLLKAAVEKCLASYEKDVNQSLECRSGSQEFSMCVNREVFLSCPAPHWTDTAECDQLKVKTAQCPAMPVIVGKAPSHHQDHPK